MAVNSGNTGKNNTVDTGAAEPSADQILHAAWSSHMDVQLRQQFAGLAQIRQARVNQLRRELADLTQAQGPTGADVSALTALLQQEQSFAAKLAIVSSETATQVPVAPPKGWVIYGRVRHADLTPAPQLTVFLADQARAWLRQYAFALTDPSGYFTLAYSPAAAPAPQAEAASTGPLSAYLEVSNSSCMLMYIDTAPMSIATGAVIYRDIVLAQETPIGSAPCGKGAPPSTPPAKR